jgi:hypothetical protein
MNFVIIILGIIVFLLMYFLYVNYFTEKMLVEKIDLNKESPVIAYDTLASPGATRYSYGVWIYVNSWNNVDNKTIFSRGVNSGDISLYLDKNTPTLNFKINRMTIPITNNFPIQKWTHVIVSIDNKIADFYLDGKLVLSKQLSEQPKVSISPIQIGGKTPNDIFLARFYRWTYPMDPQTAWNEYLSGNGQSTVLPNYGMKVSLLKDNVVNKQISLF